MLSVLLNVAFKAFMLSVVTLIVVAPRFQLQIFARKVSAKKSARCRDQKNVFLSTNVFQDTEANFINILDRF